MIPFQSNVLEILRFCECLMELLPTGLPVTRSVGSESVTRFSANVQRQLLKSFLKNRCSTFEELERFTAVSYN